ncbi:MAG: diacylglycerol kinase family protein [Ferruginibacter sp.]
MKKFIKSFTYALSGIKYCLLHEQNFKIQIVAAVIAIILAAILKCSLSEWFVILLCIGMVLALEMMNSALEKICNMQQTTFHPVIKIIKDTAAGAVLIMSLISGICGGIIFLPKIILLF